jgi:hypothetical protein
MAYLQKILQQPRNRIVLEILLIVILIAMALRGVVLHPDSDGYINGDITRSALYPTIIHCFLLLSSAHGLFLLVLFQLLLGGVAILKTIDVLQNLYHFRDLLRWTIAVVLLVPYVGGALGNDILTEGIAYPIFLFGISSFLIGIRYKRNKDFLVFLIYITLLVLTRRQFLFLYIVFGIAIVWLYVTKAQLRKSVLIAGFILSLLASTLLEKSYHFVVNGRFETAPFGGMHMAIAPIYLSSPQDTVYFTDTLQRSIFIGTRLAAQDHGLIPDEDEIFRPYAYAMNFDKILYGDLLPVLGKHNCLDPVANDRMLAAMAYILIERHWMRFIHLYGNNVIYYFGGYFFCTLVVLCFFLSLFHVIKTPSDFFSTDSFFILLTAIGNVTATCLFIFVQKRYSMYTDVFIVVLLMIAFEYSLRNWLQKNQPV